MRHRKRFNHLSRTSAHRKAMLANMASSLILHKRIKTTIAKAKALRIYVEPLITKSKEDSTHSRRVVFSYLKDKHAVSELFREVSPKIMDRPGGYTRILKTGNRLGDNADMCIIELVDYNENLLEAREATTRTARRRRSKKKTVTAQVETGADESADAAAEQAEHKVEDESETSEEVKDKPVAETSEEEKTGEEPKEKPEDSNQDA